MRKLSLAGFLSLACLSAGLFTGCSETADRSSPNTASAEKADSGGNSESPDAGDAAAVNDEKPGEAMALDEPAEESGDDGELVIGDKAPPIAIASWVKGEPLTGYAADTVHVVEFWATWCGPCLASMPHIASLQTEYGDKVTFIGVTAEDEPTVSGFMQQTAGAGDKKWADILTYRIALDDNGKTNAAFMEAAGQNGIPCAFIVGKTGLVEWIGHPMEIDEPLKQIVEGKWDSATARMAAEEAREVQNALNQTGPQIDEAVSSGDYKKAVELVDGLIARFPSNADLPMIRFQCLIGGGMSELANSTAKSLIEAAGDNAQKLDQLAWMMATGTEENGIDLDLALAAVSKAVELTDNKDISTIETMARVHFRKSNISEAISLQKKALELATNPRQIQQLQAGLAKYEAAAPAAATEQPAAVSESAPAEASPSDESSPAENAAPTDDAAPEEAPQ